VDLRDLKMAMVAVLFKVYPKDEMLDKAVANIKEQLKPAGMQTEDVAFGIKVIKVMFKFDDSKTSSSVFEEELRKVEGVSEIEVVEEGLI
jgi:translation elongation factor EF-1beta